MHRFAKMFWENIVGQLLYGKFARVQKKKVCECYHRNNLELIIDIQQSSQHQSLRYSAVYFRCLSSISMYQQLFLKVNVRTPWSQCQNSLETSFILHREPYINQVSNVYDMKKSICFLKRTPNISRCNSSCVISYIENKILVFTLTMNKKYMSKRVSSKTSFEYTESNPQCVSIYTNMQTLKRT